MPRYFLETAYMGGNYAGFQVQENANTIQAEIEKALAICLRVPVMLTGSSRTDAGVHAQQNYFHFDVEDEGRAPRAEGREVVGSGQGSVGRESGWEGRTVYSLNAILPPDISVKGIYEVGDGAHCRFDAVSRSYEYCIYGGKDPFMADRAYYYPYRMDMEALHAAAALLLTQTEFGAFSKKHSQAKSNTCVLTESFWREENGMLTYRVTGTRFLRGMVRGLVGTMLRVARGKMSLGDFEDHLRAGDPSSTDFSVPGKGLTLMRVRFNFGIGNSELGIQ